MASWNTLDVPLEIGWQCTLVLADAYRSESGDSLRFMKDDECKQLEQDQRDFASHFRPSWDLRTISGGTNLREIQAFLSEHLNVAHWNLPNDNAGVERMFKDAVASGRLVPIINREANYSCRVSRPTPAPLRWPTTGGGGSMGRSAYLFPPGTTSFNGEPVLSGPYDPASQATQLAAVRGARIASDWLRVVEDVAGAALGSDTGTDDTNTGQPSADDGTSTPLGDAQPFDYGEDAPSGDTEELAASTNNPNYAAKMLGYDRKTFGNMVHAMKDENDLRGDDNVIWHDNGDVSFNGMNIDNMHAYAP
ncbi:hypothetical protein [Paraburkholderia domus]|uniref:hypothetical protein n=1 Tax=Paraburkholderia domus TaxID=2793075 RepID=UPI001B1FFA15|nr:hypothetical protein [Paraburkholderia domus]CAE6799803.1 hypothetical protein R75483_05289 [Paraburkholderia domus]